MGLAKQLALAKLFADSSSGGSGGSGGSSGSGGGSSEEWIGDGNTHLWITLSEGRTSPMLGVLPKGTVTVDWGDGTAPDTLTGTSTGAVKWTPHHEYAEAGDYVITLTVDGEVQLYGSDSTNQGAYILRHDSNAHTANMAYQNSIKRVEIGNNVLIGVAAFHCCFSLESVLIPESVTSIGQDAFCDCYALSSIAIPNSVKTIGESAFMSCRTLTSVVIPDGVTKISRQAFNYCTTLTSVVIPDSVNMFDYYAFSQCYTISSVVVPSSVATVGNYAFENCKSIRYIDFSKHKIVPTLSNTNSLKNIAADCEIRVPATLYDEWIAATNWATYASQIVAV